MAVRVITDSTSDIPTDVTSALGIKVVPIYVRFGDKTYRDGVDIKSDELYEMLESSPVHPATSQPNPEDFTSAYKEFCDTADGIVSIHISSKVSGTYNSALIAREDMKSGCPIEVIDSKFNSAGLGIVVLAAARLAQSGAGFQEVVNEAKKVINQIGMFGVFETMEYLIRGGRVNKAVAVASRFVNVMPLLTFRDGDIVRAGLVRTFGKGMDRIYNFVNDNKPLSEVVIVHSKVPDRADLFKQRLTELVPEETISIAELGASLGVHGGPGVLLVAVRRAESL